MEKASKIMYTIANIFNYIIAALAIFGIVMSILSMTGVVKAEGNVNGLSIGAPSLVAFIIMFLVAVILIILVRAAKAKNTSKGWDILFIVLGVLEGNVFYVLGGIFGLVARR